jgi:uncharacterized protein YbaP (TraB family)
MRLPRWFPLLGLALLVQPTSAAVPESPDGKLFFWKASSPTTEVYLLGSIHLGTKEMYPLAKEIEEAFARSKYLVLEADLTKVDPVQLQQLIFSKGMYGEDDSLAKHVPAETLKSATELGGTLGLPGASIEKMKPWFLGMTIAMLSIQKLGYSAELGIDQHFAGEAKEKGKEILELESMEFQLKLLSDLSDDLQAKFLSSTIDEAKLTKEKMDVVLAAWTKGDVATFEDEMLKKPRQKYPDQIELQNKMIDDRNVGMARKVAEYLRTKDVYFVVVGAAHLVGDKGVLKLLEKDGFKVDQIEKH